ncbi:MAG: NFACT family protein [Ruminococcus sp.]|nr:NFACT family protein [Ruminococcus sp.]
MALDGMMLHHVVNELKTEALGARVYQVYQPNRDELILNLRTQNGNKRLLLSTRANSPRVHFTKYSVENPASPPMLCMLLRKRLGGGRLVDIRQAGLDRIISFDFDCVNELGDRVRITAVVEIMGKYSNVIFVDGEGKIIDALKRVDMTMSSQRLVLPNLPYEYPTPQDKLNILLTDSESVVERIEHTPDEKPLCKAILGAVQGISPVVCRELEHRVLEGGSESNKTLSKESRDRLKAELEKLSDVVLTSSGKARALYHKGDLKPFDMTFIEIGQYGSLCESKEYDSFCALLDSYYIERDSADRMRVKTADLSRLINNLINRTSNKINIQRQELEKCADREQLRIRGDLLQANLYRVERGAESVTVENFYDENGSELEIKLNPAISPAQNAQKYYKDYNKAKTAQQVLTVQIKRAEEELEYLESLKDVLSRVKSEKELSQIRLECMEQGYIRQNKSMQKKPAQLPPLEYETSDGFRVLVGRNNKQNDLLTMKTASKRDYWFHTKDIPGSHTIVVTDGREISDTAIIEAARIAAFHSKAKESTNVPVDYTLVKHVSKPNGAKPGMVIFVNNRTVYVDPALPLTKSEGG